MKIVLNRAYGAFKIPADLLEHFEIRSPWDYTYDMRFDPVFIKWVEQHKEGPLKVIQYPKTATDTYISEYDGMETLFYVVDGKICIK